MDVNSDIKVLSYLLPDVELDIPICCPIEGEEESNPSFAFFIGYKGRVLYKQHNKGLHGNMIDFIIRYEKLSVAKAIQLYKDIMNDKDLPNVNVNKDVIKKDKAVPLVCQKTCFESFEMDFFNLYRFDSDLLRSNDIKPFDSIYWNHKKSPLKSAPNDPIFIYDYGRYVKGSWKLYRPYAKNKKDKWKSNKVYGILDGVLDLPKKVNKLYVKSSKKDKMCVQKIGLHAVSPITETSLVPILKNLDYLNSIANVIIQVPDGDSAGMSVANELADKAGLNNILSLDYPPLPKKVQLKLGREFTKDDGEVVEYYGYQKLIKLYNKGR